MVDFSCQDLGNRNRVTTVEGTGGQGHLFDLIIVLYCMCVCVCVSLCQVYAFIREG